MRLEQHHIEDLRRSGLSDEFIRLAKFFSVTHQQAAKTLGFDSGSPGLAIPYPNTNGSGPLFIRVKPDKPFRDEGGRAAKYLSAKGGGNRLYVPHIYGKKERLDRECPVILTEGEKKACKAAQELPGFVAVALPGVWCRSPWYIPHRIISDVTETKAILLRTEGGWMARRKLSMNEYLEMVYQWHRGRSVRQIRDSLRMSRKTIHKYLRRLAEEGLSRERPLPEEAELAQRVAAVVNSAVFEQPARERIRPYHQQIVDWLSEPDMTLRQVQRLLEENHELGVSYMSVHRYVRSHIQPLERPVTVRLHPPAGEQAQVDFGYAGLMRDPESGKLRRAWAFILILSHSRHRFVRFVFRQDNRTWLDCHIRALKFFGGCPTLIVLDNLKNGVLRPDLYDPTLNPAYAELERHYGFVADPAKVAMARHKGKVERCVPVVRQQLLAGREFRDIDEANQRALQWCLQEVGLREHGTTHRKPYEVFLAEDAPELLPLPEQPYEGHCQRKLA